MNRIYNGLNVNVNEQMKKYTYWACFFTWKEAPHFLAQIKVNIKHFWTECMLPWIVNTDNLFITIKSDFSCLIVCDNLIKFFDPQTESVTLRGSTFVFTTAGQVKLVILFKVYLLVIYDSLTYIQTFFLVNNIYKNHLF